MSVRRVISVLSVLLVASATIVVAQPKKDAPKAPVAPAKDAAPAAGSAAPAGSGSAEGSAVEMVEDPPADMEGINEDPDAPKTGDGSAAVMVVPEKLKTSGYPIEEALRPITLPANMSEISLGVIAPVDPFHATAVLRARYGITGQVQLGLTYVLAGVYDDPGTAQDKTSIHPGKAVGLDVTVLMQDWIGIRVGVPAYIDPVAFALQLGAPMRFRFAGGKLTLGGLDDLLTIRIYEFPPSLTSELQNSFGATNADDSNTIQSNGNFRVSAYAIYQQSQKTALIGRIGTTLEDFSGTRSDSGGGSTTFIRAGVQHSPRKFLDVGLSLGWEDLSKLGAFAPLAYVNLRI